MTIVSHLVIVWLFLIGLYGIATSRNTIHLVSCLFVSQSSTYILLLTIGYRAGGTAPIIDESVGAMVDPVVQSLALTDIVVGATVSALILVYAVQAWKRTGRLDQTRLSDMKG